jgi:hypothetical protein
MGTRTIYAEMRGDIHIDLHVQCTLRLFGFKQEITRQFVVKLSNIRFQEHPMCASRGVREQAVGRKNGRKDFNTRSAWIWMCRKRELKGIWLRQYVLAFCASKDSSDYNHVGDVSVD